MKLFKKTIAVLALAALSVSMVACGSSKATTESASEKKDGTVIAKVGDVSIYKSDLDNQMAEMDYYMSIYYGADFKSNAEVMAQYNAYKDNVVDSLIEAEILVLKAKEMKEIEVTDADVEADLEATKARFSTEEEFNTALEQSGMTLDDLKANIAKNLYVNKLIDYYAAKQEVTDEEISEYYNTNIAAYTTGAGANLSHILVDSEEKANEVLEKYNAGTSFEDLAAEYGTDGTKETGGSLGYIPYENNQYDTDFMAAAKLVGEGQVSEPVKTQFGWHLIKADGIQAEDVVEPLEDVKEEIKTLLADTKAQEELTTQLTEWKKDYTIEKYEDLYKEEVVVSEETTETTSPEATTESTESTDSGVEESPATTESTATN